MLSVAIFLVHKFHTVLTLSGCESSPHLAVKAHKVDVFSSAETCLFAFGNPAAVALFASPAKTNVCLVVRLCIFDYAQICAYIRSQCITQYVSII